MVQSIQPRRYPISTPVIGYSPGKGGELTYIEKQNAKERFANGFGDVSSRALSFRRRAGNVNVVKKIQEWALT